VVSLLLAIRRGMRAGLCWSLLITLSAGLFFLVITGGLGDDGDGYGWEDFAITALVFVLLPNVAFALIGGGISTIRRRRNGRSLM
jgi:hypothetical protein